MTERFFGPKTGPQNDNSPLNLWSSTHPKKSRENPVHDCTAFFEANEHGGYTLTVPALPGLVTEGKDLEHARAMARDAVRCYIEGLKKAKEPIPVERETAQVKISIGA